MALCLDAVLSFFAVTAVGRSNAGIRSINRSIEAGDDHPGRELVDIDLDDPHGLLAGPLVEDFSTDLLIVAGGLGDCGSLR